MHGLKVVLQVTQARLASVLQLDGRPGARLVDEVVHLRNGIATTDSALPSDTDLAWVGLMVVPKVFFSIFFDLWRF